MLRACSRTTRRKNVRRIYLYIFFSFFFFTSIDGGENFAYNLPVLRRFDQERWT